jgi:hypothetical protein
LLDVRAQLALKCPHEKMLDSRFKICYHCRAYVSEN